MIHERSPRFPRLVALGVLLVLTAAACGVSTTVDAGPVAEPPGEQPTATPAEQPQATATPEAADPQAQASLAALADARSSWADNGAARYSYTYTRSCECTEEARGPFHIVVANDAVIAKEISGTPTTEAGWTAEDLFDEIESVITDGRQVDVQYGAGTGFPSAVTLDVEAVAVDGGLSFTVDSFLSYDELQVDLDEARGVWEATATIDYDLTYRLNCFCPATTFAVQVRGGEIVDHNISGEVNTGVEPLTVDGLFELIQGSIDDGVFRLEANYEPDSGYPIDFYVDEVEMIADEEFGVSAVTVVAVVP